MLQTTVWMYFTLLPVKVYEKIQTIESTKEHSRSRLSYLVQTIGLERSWARSGKPGMRTNYDILLIIIFSSRISGKIKLISSVNKVIKQIYIYNIRLFDYNTIYLYLSPTAQIPSTIFIF